MIEKIRYLLDYNNYNNSVPAVLDLSFIIKEVIMPDGSVLKIKANQIPYEFFFLDKKKTLDYYFLLNSNNLNVYWFFFEPNQVYYISLLLKTGLSQLNYSLLELFNFFSDQSQHLTYSWVSYFFDQRLLVTTKCTAVIPSIQTISTLLPNAVWLEREILEFTGLSFLGLQDTRRLLTDYTFSKKNIYVTEKTSNYNTIFQEIVN